MVFAAVVTVAQPADETPIPECVPHLLPCEIKYSGPAPVNVYFKPSPGAAGSSPLQSEFRGRRLQGSMLEFPEGYEGLLLQDTIAASIADGEARRAPRARTHRHAPARTLTLAERHTNSGAKPQRAGVRRRGFGFRKRGSARLHTGSTRSPPARKTR